MPWWGWVLVIILVTLNVIGWFGDDDDDADDADEDGEEQHLANVIYDLRTEIIQMRQQLTPLSEGDRAQVQQYIECLQAILRNRVVSDGEADEDGLAFAITNLSMLAEKSIRDVA